MNPIDLQVRTLIANQLGLALADVAPTNTLTTDLGADSLDVIELVMSLEDEFRFEVPDESVERIVTVQDAVDFVVAHHKP